MGELYTSILEAHRARVDVRRLTEASLMSARESPPQVGEKESKPGSLGIVARGCEWRGGGSFAERTAPPPPPFLIRQSIVQMLNLEVINYYRQLYHYNLIFTEQLHALNHPSPQISPRTVYEGSN